MTHQLSIALGQHSDPGRKDSNQDFHGACIPHEPLLTTKGIAVAIADGISSSTVSRAASEAAVRALLDDYFCTSPAWSVKTSAQRVLLAANSWLHAQTRHSPFRYDMDRGYVCTLSALIFKGTTAHLFHVGDTRIYRLQDGLLEQLTNDHRLRVSQEQSYLSRALGMHAQLDIDYQAFAIEPGEVFVLASDGVYEFVDAALVSAAVGRHRDDLDAAARDIVEAALARGSDDNLTIQIVRIEDLPEQDVSVLQQQALELALPPLLEPGTSFDGYRILRELHASSRSHVYLAKRESESEPVAIKIPSLDLRGDPAYLERFLMEDWIARRIHSPHVLRSRAPTHQRTWLYTVMEFVDGQTLAQWLLDHPRADLETIRDIVEQIAKGLRAFHRMEMLHQDLRPANVMIDAHGTVKLIDFGAAHVAGVAELDASESAPAILGTAQYTAPEYFLGEPATTRSDLFSLGVITYQMLSGRLPYGAEVAKARTRAAQRALRYRSVLNDEREIPAWLDDVLRKATHPDPSKRYEELSEFLYDLRHPGTAYLNRTRAPLIERNPAAVWQAISFALAVIVLILLATR